MKNNFLLNFLFNRTTFKQRVSKMSECELVDALQDSLNRNNFELAAYLKYYLDFKFNKADCN